MKRYRVLNVDFDTRATILSIEIKEDWDSKVKALWQNNKQQIRSGLLAEFGPYDHERKLVDFIALGPAPWSVLSFHNKFLRQIRRAFVFGSYYPALTGACALGERILNHLVLNLRDFYKSTPEYKAIYRKASFDNWDLPINALESWKVLLPAAVLAFRRLKDIRNNAIHFRPEADSNDRALALESIKIVGELVEHQFGATGAQPWFIPITQGVEFLKLGAEKEPFVQLVYIPNSKLVGPMHQMEMSNNGWVVKDEHDYPDEEITDEKFVEMFLARKIS